MITQSVEKKEKLEREAASELPQMKAEPKQASHKTLQAPAAAPAPAASAKLPAPVAQPAASAATQPIPPAAIQAGTGNPPAGSPQAQYPANLRPELAAATTPAAVTASAAPPAAAQTASTLTPSNGPAAAAIPPVTSPAMQALNSQFNENQQLIDDTVASVTAQPSQVTAKSKTIEALYDPEKGQHDVQSSLDDIKKRYEDIIVIHLFLKKCNKVQPNDFSIITNAMAQEASSADEPEKFKSDIMTAAQGSYNEMYSNSPCTSNGIDRLSRQYNSYIKILSDDFPQG